MIGPPAYVPKRGVTGLFCSLIGAASIVLALAVGGAATDDSRGAALDRSAAGDSASNARSSASVAASLPSPQEVRDRFPRPAGTFQKSTDEPNRGTFFYYTRGLTFAQVRAFYENIIPRTFPTLVCRFKAFSSTQQECGLREDVDFGQIDVWSKVGQVNELKPGEIFVRLTLDGLE